MKKISICGICMIALVALAIWAPNVYAFGGFDDGGGEGVPACAECHPDIANFGPDHGTHATLSNNDCDSCHLGGDDFNNPPLDNCVRCHGRDDDGNPSADLISAGIGRGLRQHHVTVGVAACGNCHQDTDHATTGSATEDVVPAFYPSSNVALDPCDGSEEQFDSRSMSLDNDGDGLTDGDDPDCQPPPECTIDADCDDGVFCNGAEVCDPSGTCQTGTPPECDDGIGCTDDSCETVADACVNTPNDANCDDGDLCTVDTCSPVADCVFDPVICPDGEQCDPADGLCKPTGGCQTDADCDDQMFCNGVETCDVATGACQPGMAPDCDDLVGCTEDLCDEALDECRNVPNDANCDDGEFCNGAETCDATADCQAGMDPCAPDETCDEVNDVCVPPAECIDDADCDDGLFCNGAEFCDANGMCQPGMDPCAPNETCNEDTETCEPVVGKVTICHIPLGNPAKARTLSINAMSVADHLDHGDLLGPCP